MNSNETFFKHKLTRRSLLVGTSAISLEAIASLTGAKYLTPGLWDNKQDYAEEVDSILKSTAVALNEAGMDVSEVPESIFPRELVESVRLSTFVIELYRNYDQRYSIATAWCAKKDDQDLYLVTNRHVVKSPADLVPSVGEFNFWRPEHDDYKNQTISPLIAFSNDVDLAVVKCRVPRPVADNIEPLRFIDGSSVTSGEKLLTIGYPGAFINAKTGEIDFPTSAQIITADSTGAETQNIEGYGLINHGSSGSPLVRMGDNFEPEVIGTVWGMNSNKIYEDPDTGVKSVKVYAAQLHIQNLIDSL